MHTIVRQKPGIEEFLTLGLGLETRWLYFRLQLHFVFDFLRDDQLLIKTIQCRAGRKVTHIDGFWRHLGNLNWGGA